LIVAPGPRIETLISAAGDTVSTMLTPRKTTRDPASASPQDKVRESLLRHYFTDKNYLQSEIGQRDLANHLELRLKSARQRVIPWIESFLPLSGRHILQVGCGTGSSTLAMAERGAHITAFDIARNSIRVAQERCLAHGYSVEFMVGNAANLKRRFSRRRLDGIIYYAVLEHMTHEERRKSLGEAWEILEPGALLIVVETPNRLWYFDGHTALLPFYHWLPDRLAFEYARFSEREFFRDRYHAHTRKNELHFLRRGRGVSFHDFELFIAPLKSLEIVSCMQTYFRAQNAAEQERWSNSVAGRYQGILREVSPYLHPAFLEQYLDLAIRRK
jgi:S-adenosylmethionine-dependent methyltransferase